MTSHLIRKKIFYQMTQRNFSRKSSLKQYAERHKSHSGEE